MVVLVHYVWFGVVLFLTAFLISWMAYPIVLRMARVWGFYDNPDARKLQRRPVPVMGGVSMLLFGVIAASGIRVLVESKIDYNKPINLMLTAVVLGIGVSTASITLGTVTLKGMSLATVVAIILSVAFNIIKNVRGEE